MLAQTKPFDRLQVERRRAHRYFDPRSDRTLERKPCSARGAALLQSASQRPRKCRGSRRSRASDPDR